MYLYKCIQHKCLALSHGSIQCLYSVEHLSLLVDNGTDGVREGFVMHGCPAPESFSALLAGLYMHSMLHLLNALRRYRVMVLCWLRPRHLLPIRPTPKPVL